VSDLGDAIHDLAGHSAIADAAARFAADYLVYFALVVVAWLFLRQPSRRPVLAALGAAIIAVGAAGLIGVFYYVPRPFVSEHFIPLVQHAPDASFPSDHLAALGALVGSTWLAARRLAIATLAVAAAVAFARVYVGVHWLADVLGGFALGVVCGGILWRLLAFSDRWASPFDDLRRRLRLRACGPAHG